MTTDNFWLDVETHLGGVLSANERLLLERHRDPSDYADASDDELRASTVRAAVDEIRFIRTQFAGEHVAPPPLPRDERWGVLKQLDERFSREATTDELAPWELVAIGAVRADLDREPYSRRVTITFDHRLSQDALVKQIRQLWPDLRRQGLVRHTRRLGDRKIALIRHVCLTATSGDSWSARCESWNATHAQWSYGSGSEFVSAFRSAEKSLTGTRYGLEWFYDPSARLSLGELKQHAAKGDRTAHSRLQRLEEERRQLLDAFWQLQNVGDPPWPNSTVLQRDVLLGPKPSEWLAPRFLRTTLATPDSDYGRPLSPSELLDQAVTSLVDEGAGVVGDAWRRVMAAAQQAGHESIDEFMNLVQEENTDAEQMMRSAVGNDTLMRVILAADRVTRYSRRGDSNG